MRCIELWSASHRKTLGLFIQSPCTKMLDNQKLGQSSDTATRAKFTRFEENNTDKNGPWNERIIGIEESEVEKAHNTDVHSDLCEYRFTIQLDTMLAPDFERIIALTEFKDFIFDFADILRSERWSGTGRRKAG